jgi:hypothetical protein
MPFDPPLRWPWIKKTPESVAMAAKTTCDPDGYAEFTTAMSAEKSASLKKPARKNWRCFPISPVDPRLLDFTKRVLVVATLFVKHYFLKRNHFPFRKRSFFCLNFWNASSTIPGDYLSCIVAEARCG